MSIAYMPYYAMKFVSLGYKFERKFERPGEPPYIITYLAELFALGAIGEKSRMPLGS